MLFRPSSPSCVSCRDLPPSDSGGEEVRSAPRPSLLAGLPPAVVDRIFQSGQTIHHERGHVLFVQQDRAQAVYLVLSGWVKLFRETLEGSEAVIDILPAGHFFGESALFNSRLYPFGAQMVESGSLTAFPLCLFEDLLAQEPRFTQNLLSSMARTQRRQDQELEHRSLQNAPQRIGCFLLQLCADDLSCPQIVHLPYDKTLVAARLGMQPETFSRALSRLKNDVGLTLHGAHVEIPDPKRLKRYTCSGCSGTWPCRDRC